MIKTIHLDMDGVLVDFDGYIKKFTGKTPEELNKGCGQSHSNDERMDPVYRVMKEHIENHDMFSNCEPFKDLDLWKELINTLHEHKIRVVLLSAAPGEALYDQSKEQKIRWVHKHKLIVDDIQIVHSARQKGRYARSDSVLIDDYPKNVHHYIDSGGNGIIHTDFDSTIIRLEHFVGKIF